MKGDTAKEDKKDDEGDKNGNNVVPDDNDKYAEYSCVNWSDWTKERVNDSYLEERSKTLVQGVKYQTQTKTVYGKWSEYTTKEKKKHLPRQVFFYRLIYLTIAFIALI